MRGKCNTPAENKLGVHNIFTLGRKHGVDIRRGGAYNLIMNKKRTTYIAAAVAAVCAAIFLIIYFAPLQFSSDPVCDGLWRDVLPRVALTVAVMAVAALCGYGGFFKISRGDAARNILWCLPCFAVALANFPYSALASGSAVIDRPDLIWLFLLKCLFIAASEELLFRGILLRFLQEVFEKKKHAFILSVVTSSAVFALFHLLNLAEGAGVGATMLQVGYTFLTGLVFACVTARTGNVWGAIIIHFVFDIGGLIVTDLGHGQFQDAVFWALTAIAAAICAVHLVLYAIKRDGAESRSQNDDPPEC